MKKVFFLLIMLIQAEVFAQVTVHSIDFATLQPKYKFTVPHKGSVQIKLTNINRKVYKVEDEKSEEDFNITLPDALKGIKLPGFIFSLPSAVPKAADAQSPGISKEEINEWKNIDNIIKQLISAIEYKAERLNEAVLYYNDINHLVKDCSLPSVNIVSSITNKTVVFLYNNSSDPYPGSNLAQRLKDTLFIQRKDAEQKLSELKKRIEGYIKGMPGYIDVKIKNLEEGLKEAEEGLNSAIKKKDPHEQQEIKMAILERRRQIENFKSEKVKLEKSAVDMQEKLKKVEEIVDAMREFEKDDKIYPIHTAFKIYTNSKNYEYSSVIVNPEKDETKLVLNITPEGLNECSGADKRSTEIKLRAKGGLKVDVSTGAFINGGNEDFLGSTFYYEKLTADTRQIVIAERNNRLMLSVGALLHFYQRSPAKVKLGGSVGVSTTADFTDLNFHAGPSLILGNKNRLILTTGLTLKSSKVLDRQLQIEKSYESDKTPDDIPTVSVFPKAGWFIGLTYNLNILK